MEIKRMKISDLEPAPYNPRIELEPGDSDYEKLKQSIERFGHVQPIIWNQRTGYIVGGHQSITILRDLGETDVDCVIVDVSPEDEKALNVALNKIDGRWDKDKLEDILQELANLDKDLFEVTGFTDEEVEELIKETELAEESFYTEEVTDKKETHFNYQEQYGVIVICENEQIQQRVYEDLVLQGYTCKVVAT